MLYIQRVLRWSLTDLLRLGHHHLTEFIKVHGPGAILIQLLNDAIELLVSQGGEQLTNQGPQGVVGDVAKTLSVVDPNQELDMIKPMHI